MNSQQIMLKMISDRWNASVKNFDTLLNSLSDEQVQREIAPGKNRGTYILGHLIAVHDDMIRLLDMGDKLFPELYKIFIEAPDKTIDTIPTVKVLRDSWSKQCEVLRVKFEGLKTEDWFEKHSAVSAEDFIKEPHRNKLNIVITRTTHLAYHTGQMALLK